MYIYTYMNYRGFVFFKLFLQVTSYTMHITDILPLQFQYFTHCKNFFFKTFYVRKLSYANSLPHGKFTILRYCLRKVCHDENSTYLCVEIVGAKKT